MDFLETIETIRAEEASVQRLFRGDGTGVRHARRSPEYMGLLAEAATLVADVCAGRKPMRYLSEAMSTSDFPQLFGDVLDRQLLANYRETPITWPAYIKRSTVPDFRTVKRFRVDGAEGVLTEVPQGTGYPATAITDAEYTYSVKKYGRRLPFLWEAFVNDDLDALRDGPDRLARAARRTEERFATGLFVGTDGPNSTFYASGNANVVTGNPALSIESIQTAYTVLGSMVDTDGEPIVIDAAVLVVPPALEVVAQSILNATVIRNTAATGGGASGRELEVANWMRSKLKLVVNPYIPILATNNKHTSWFLFSDPGNGRPAAEMGFLRGHEEPELFMKAPNATRIGGGPVDPVTSGDFDTDSVDYKVRHVLGGTLLDPKMSVASQGDGS